MNSPGHSAPPPRARRGAPSCDAIFIPGGTSDSSTPAIVLTPSSDSKARVSSAFVGSGHGDVDSIFFGVNAVPTFAFDRSSTTSATVSRNTSSTLIPFHVAPSSFGLNAAVASSHGSPGNGSLTFLPGIASNATQSGLYSRQLSPSFPNATADNRRSSVLASFLRRQSRPWALSGIESDSNGVYSNSRNMSVGVPGTGGSGNTFMTGGDHDADTSPIPVPPPAWEPYRSDGRGGGKEGSHRKQYSLNHVPFVPLPQPVPQQQQQQPPQLPLSGPSSAAVVATTTAGQHRPQKAGGDTDKGSWHAHQPYPPSSLDSASKMPLSHFYDVPTKGDSVAQPLGEQATVGNGSPVYVRPPALNSSSSGGDSFPFAPPRLCLPMAMHAGTDTVRVTSVDQRWVPRPPPGPAPYTVTTSASTTTASAVGVSGTAMSRDKSTDDATGGYGIMGRHILTSGGSCRSGRQLSYSVDSGLLSNTMSNTKSMHTPGPNTPTVATVATAVPDGASLTSGATNTSDSVFRGLDSRQMQPRAAGTTVLRTPLPLQLTAAESALFDYPPVRQEDDDTYMKVALAGIAAATAVKARPAMTTSIRGHFAEAKEEKDTGAAEHDDANRHRHDDDDGADHVRHRTAAHGVYSCEPHESSGGPPAPLLETLPRRSYHRQLLWRAPYAPDDARGSSLVQLFTPAVPATAKSNSSANSSNDRRLVAPSGGTAITNVGSGGGGNGTAGLGTGAWTDHRYPDEDDVNRTTGSTPTAATVMPIATSPRREAAPHHYPDGVGTPAAVTTVATSSLPPSVWSGRHPTVEGCPGRPASPPPLRPQRVQGDSPRQPSPYPRGPALVGGSGGAAQPPSQSPLQSLLPLQPPSQYHLSVASSQSSQQLTFTWDHTFNDRGIVNSPFATSSAAAGLMAARGLTAGAASTEDGGTPRAPYATPGNSPRVVTTAGATPSSISNPVAVTANTNISANASSAAAVAGGMSAPTWVRRTRRGSVESATAGPDPLTCSSSVAPTLPTTLRTHTALGLARRGERWQPPPAPAGTAASALTEQGRPHLDTLQALRRCLAGLGNGSGGNGSCGLQGRLRGHEYPNDHTTREEATAAHTATTTTTAHHAAPTALSTETPSDPEAINRALSKLARYNPPGTSLSRFSSSLATSPSQSISGFAASNHGFGSGNPHVPRAKMSGGSITGTAKVASNDSFQKREDGTAARVHPSVTGAASTSSKSCSFLVGNANRTGWHTVVTAAPAAAAPVANGNALLNESAPGVIAGMLEAMTSSNTTPSQPFPAPSAVATAAAAATCANEEMPLSMRLQLPLPIPIPPSTLTAATTISSGCTPTLLGNSTASHLNTSWLVPSNIGTEQPSGAPPKDTTMAAPPPPALPQTLEIGTWGGGAGSSSPYSDSRMPPLGRSAHLPGPAFGYQSSPLTAGSGTTGVGGLAWLGEGSEAGSVSGAAMVAGRPPRALLSPWRVVHADAEEEPEATVDTTAAPEEDEDLGGEMTAKVEDDRAAGNLHSQEGQPTAIVESAAAATPEQSKEDDGYPGDGGSSPEVDQLSYLAMLSERRRQRFTPTETKLSVE